MSVCVSRFCLCDISLTAQPFVTKQGMVVYYHELECHAEKFVCYLQGQGHSEGIYVIKMWLFLLHFLNFWCIASKLGLIVQHHKPECAMEKSDCCQARWQALFIFFFYYLYVLCTQLFLTGKDYGGRFDELFSSCAFFFFSSEGQHAYTGSTLLGQGSVHSGLARLNDCGQAFPHKLQMSLFRQWVPTLCQDSTGSPVWVHHYGSFKLGMILNLSWTLHVNGSWNF